VKRAALALLLTGCFRFPIEGVPVDASVGDLADDDGGGTIDLGGDLAGADLRGRHLVVLPPVDVAGTDEIALADFDGNGRVDLLVVGTTAGSAAIYSGIASVPMFDASAVASYPLLTPMGVALAQLDGDSAIDVAIASSGGNHVHVFQGKIGGFPLPVGSYATGSRPQSVAVGDMNNDTFPDLLVSSAMDSTITILFGNASRTFGPGTAPMVLAGPHRLAVGSLNGDITRDLVVTAQQGDKVQVMRGSGAAMFAGAVDYAAIKPGRVQLGDLDQDGDTDVVLATAAAQVQVMINDGNASFIGPTAIGNPGAQRGLALVDLDADGRLDIVVADGASSAINVLIGQGNGQFHPVASYPVSQPNAIAIADLNGDGKPDVVATSNHGFSPPRATVLLNGL
jgi:hypothetical protein